MWELPDATLAFRTVPSDRVVFSSYFNPISLTALPESADPESIEVLRKLLQSEIGWLFLDRTRIRPVGFALGEHVQSLSLAPGEELVVEQKTFSKREATFEDQTEQERQVDLELASTLSTELTEGLDRESSRNEQTGFQVGGSAGGTIGPVTVKADASYSKSVSEASSQAQKRSVKDSTTATSKVAAKYRAMHKTVLKISTESRFESGSKRVIRNPNPYSAVDLHYFKIMQRLELVQERYGCRLCWAVPIKDPASDLMQRINNGKQLIIDRAVAAVALPKKPDPPALPNRPPRVEKSSVKEADKWGFSGDMRAEYDLTIPIPALYAWNGDVDSVRRLTTVTGRPPENMSWGIVGTPWIDGGNLIVRIRVGAASWFGGPKVFMQAAATFVAQPPENDPNYQKAYQDYKAALLRWEADVALALEAPRRAAETAADEWAHEMLASLDPARELMDQIAKRTFRGAMSDEPWEVSFWGQVFDWERAGVALYPSWWSDQPARDYLRGPNNFLNASWATLYLPARPRFERLALRWIIAKGRDQVLDAETEKAITRLVDELKAFRTANFGDAGEASVSAADGAVSEKFLVLGRWEEVLPTDGTHMEMVQSMTSAGDADGQERLRVAAQLLATRLTAEQQDVELKKKALALSTPTATKLNYQVSIGTENEGTIHRG